MAPIPHQFIDPTLVAADSVYCANGNSETARPYLGMSSIGRPCSRELWYSFHWCSASSFDADTLKRFEDGHRSEAIQIERLRAVAGVQLFITDPRNQDDGQIACKDLGGHLRGHLDGVILGLIQAPKTPHVWEHKCTNEKKQAKLTALKTQHGEKSAFKEWDATYYAQAVLYMHYQSLTRHYLTVASPGSRTCISCRTNADPQAAQALIAKAQRIITAQEPLPRLSERPDWYECQWCSHHSICHQRAIPQVNCRTCAHSTPELNGNGRWTCARFTTDLPVSTQRQGNACPYHVFIPALLPWKAIDADETAGWVEYDNGLKNGNGFIASTEIKP